MNRVVVETTIDERGIACVTLDRPPVNALTSAQFGEIAAAFDALGRNPAVRVVVLAARGRSFCAGLDVKELASDRAAVVEINRQVFAAFESIHRCAVPVIAAVQGFALGGGLAMVGACDLALASDSAQFGLPEIDRGVLGGASHVLRILPLFVVREAYYTGRFLSAAEVFRLGGLNAVHAAEDLLPKALELAGRIAEKSPSAIRLAKEALNGIEPVDLERNYRFEQGFTLEVSFGQDAEEARRAFLEKRSPNFRR